MTFRKIMLSLSIIMMAIVFAQGTLQPLVTQGDNSCEFAFDNECDEPYICAEGTDTSDCINVDRSCPYVNDGDCDEPGIGTGLCFSGTDTADCAGIEFDPANSCPYAFDNECDEPGIGTGFCDAGTDTADCYSQPPPLCPYTNNSICDEPERCPAGTDTADCQVTSLPRITLAQSTARPNEVVTINFSNAPGSSSDWIGLYAQGAASDREYTSWQYLGGQQQGSVQFTLPDTAGTYEFRMFANDGYDLLTSSTLITISAGPESTPLTCDQLANSEPLASVAIDDNLSVSCPANCPTTGRLWGTDIYTDDSIVCLAATHAGVIDSQGGSFSVSILPGQDSYQASERNGVSSTGYGSWGRSFSFSSATPPPERENVTFTGETWHWFDPNDDASYQVSGDSITISAGNGNDLYPAYNFDAPRFTKTVTGDFSFTVRVQPNFVSNYNGATVIAQVNQNTLIRFERGTNNTVDIGLYDNGNQITNMNISSTDTDLHMRLERRGNIITGYARAVNNPSWTKVGEVTVTFPSQIEVGVGVVNQHNDQLFQSRFSEFSWSRSVSSQVDIAGTWQVNFNGFIGRMTFSQTATGWQGTLDLGGGNETLQDVQFDGQTLRFTRPLASNTQHYTGQFSQDTALDRLNGSFLQDSAGDANFTWSAEKAHQGPPPPPAASASITVKSDEAATLQSNEGVVIEIPAGAVPLFDDNSIGQAVFSVESSTVTPQLSPQFAVMGDVYQLGPEGQLLEQPVKLTLPIAANADISKVYGIATLDNVEGAWLTTPGVVDTNARTVSIWTDHFSPNAPVGWRLDEAQNRQDGGWLEIRNDRSDTENYDCADDDRDCRGMQAKHIYGVCLLQWDLEQPSLQFWGNRDGMSRTANAADGETIRWWLPDGTYTIEEYFHSSEYGNISPLYVPRHDMFVKSAQIVTISNGNVIPVGANYPQGYVAGWSTCHGGSGPNTERVPRRIYQTGDVQVTLTWSGPVDVDLYVKDPNNETIFFSTPSSSSGGQLDRDNRCGDTVLGGPENIAWPQKQTDGSGGAPAGNYVVSVDYYGYCGDSDQAPSVPWTVRVIVGGSASSYSGSLSPGEEQEVTSFSNVTSVVIGHRIVDKNPDNTVPQDPNDEGCWASYTDDPRAFTTQPSKFFPHLTLTEAGNYTIHVGPSGSGLPKKPASWRSYGPYTINLGSNYRAVIDSSGSLGWGEGGAELLNYSTSPGQATLYARNDYRGQWYSICVQDAP